MLDQEPYIILSGFKHNSSLITMNFENILRQKEKKEDNLMFHLQILMRYFDTRCLRERKNILQIQNENLKDNEDRAVEEIVLPHIRHSG